METFTVTLPEYKFTIRFNTQDFVRLFPGSLIALALQSGENDIPLSNTMVTSEILQLLSQILTTQDYPYVSIPNAKQILDYLGIDLPEFVYDSKYGMFRRDNPGFSMPMLDEWYTPILRYSIDTDFSELARYVLDHTDLELHQEDDIKLVQTNTKEGPYVSGGDHILPIIVTQRKLLPKIVTKYLVANVAERGYIELFDLIQGDTTDLRTPLSESIILIASSGISIDPEHFTEHVEMINHIRINYKDKLNTTDARYYDAFNKTITGKANKIFNPSSVYLMTSDLLYTALFMNHPISFGYLYAVGVRSVSRDVKHANQLFLRSYFSHPDIITPDNLRVVKYNLTPQQQFEWANKLTQSGHMKLAQDLVE